jgi:hypothetical protein
MGARTLPQTGEALGQLSASSNGGPADGAATVMRELLGDGAQSPTAGRDPLDAIFGDLGQDPGQSVDAAAARPDAAVVVPAAPPAGAAPPRGAAPAAGGRHARSDARACAGGSGRAAQSPAALCSPVRGE